MGLCREQGVKCHHPPRVYKACRTNRLIIPQHTCIQTCRHTKWYPFISFLILRHAQAIAVIHWMCRRLIGVLRSEESKARLLTRVRGVRGWLRVRVDWDLDCWQLRETGKPESFVIWRGIVYLYKYLISAHCMYSTPTYCISFCVDGFNVYPVHIK